MSKEGDLLREIVNGDPRSKNKLKDTQEKPPIESVLGSADYEESASGGAIVRTETDVADREYFDEQVVASSDGVITMMLAPEKVKKYTDAGGNPHEDHSKEKIF